MFYILGPCTGVWETNLKWMYIQLFESQFSTKSGEQRY